MARLVLEPVSPLEARRRRPLYAAAGLAAGLAAAVALAALTPAGAGRAASAMLRVLSSPQAWGLALPYLVAILFSAAGLAFAHRAGFITIGAEGQMVLGMLAYYWAAGLEGWGPVAAAAVAAAVGAGYGLLVGVLRTHLRVNETLSSLMLNYIAYGVLAYLVAGPWRAGSFTRTAPLPQEAMVSPAAAAAAAVAAALLLEAVLRYTRLGVAVEAVGLARRAAETYGASWRRTYLAAAAAQGASAGLGGGLYLAASTGVLYARSSYGYGYIGILAAWLAARSPAATILASMLLALLYIVNSRLQLAGVEASFALAMQAVLVASVVTAWALAGYRVRLRRR